MGHIFALLVVFGVINTSGGSTPDRKISYRFSSSSVSSTGGGESSYSMSKDKITKSGMTVYTLDNNNAYQNGIKVFTKNSSTAVRDVKTGVCYTRSGRDIKSNGTTILQLL